MNVYIKTQTCMYIFKKKYVVYILNIFIYNINYINISVNIFKIYTVCVCLYIHNKYTHTHI